MSLFNKGGRDFAAETTSDALFKSTTAEHKHLLFDALRAANLHAIRNIFSINRNLVNDKLFGYEGHDIYESIPNSRTHRCYTYTGQEKDGFFSPLHVAAECGHKTLVLLLVKAGADISAFDYRKDLPEQRCNGDAQFAFYELKGLKYEETERYEGSLNAKGLRHGNGSFYRKTLGYLSKEKLIYRGGWKNGLQHGSGTLFWAASLFPDSNVNDNTSVDGSVNGISNANQNNPAMPPPPPEVAESSQDFIRLVGRFRHGFIHGRGAEFNVENNKIYQGSFRQGLREGNGDEFENNTLSYRGEFLNNLRHGFGATFFAEGHIFIGRFDGGFMSGVGVSFHPNGDRYEGMFYNNKPDGHGSFYQCEPTTGLTVATHALYSMGRKNKEMTSAFEPTATDMPDLLSHDNSLSNGELLRQYNLGATEEEINKLDTGLLLEAKQKTPTAGVNKWGVLNRPANSTKKPDFGAALKKVRSGGSDASVTVDPEGSEEKESASALRSGVSEAGTLSSTPNDETVMTLGGEKIIVADNWKLVLAKHVRLPLKFQQQLQLIPESINGVHDSTSGSAAKSKVGDEGSSAIVDGAGDVDGQTEDDSLGTRFVEVHSLYIAYVYVSSAAKVFECRDATREVQVTVPEFSDVYNLVIDAVENYNDLWEKECKAQQAVVIQSEMERIHEDKNSSKKPYSTHATHAHPPGGKGGGGAPPASDHNTRNQPSVSTTAPKTLETVKRHAFMSEVEKKQELVLKQRAELAAKKNLAELGPEIVKRLGGDVLHDLQSELQKLLHREETIPDTASTKEPTATAAASVQKDKAEVKEEEVDDEMDGTTSVSTNEFATELLYILKTSRDSL